MGGDAKTQEDRLAQILRDAELVATHRDQDVKSTLPWAEMPDEVRCYWRDFASALSKRMASVDSLSYRAGLMAARTQIVSLAKSAWKAGFINNSDALTESLVEIDRLINGSVPATSPLPEKCPRCKGEKVLPYMTCGIYTAVCHACRGTGLP